MAESQHEGNICSAPAFPCPPPSSQTLLTCELSNLLWEGALCWVLILGWWAGQMALKLLLLLENAKINREKDPHKTKTKNQSKVNGPSLLLRGTPVEITFIISFGGFLINSMTRSDGAHRRSRRKEWSSDACDDMAESRMHSYEMLQTGKSIGIKSRSVVA